MAKRPFGGSAAPPSRDTPAQYNLGRSYEQDRGVRRDRAGLRRLDSGSPSQRMTAHWIQ